MYEEVLLIFLVPSKESFYVTKETKNYSYTQTCEGALLFKHPKDGRVPEASPDSECVRWAGHAAVAPMMSSVNVDNQVTL